MADSITTSWGPTRSAFALAAAHEAPWTRLLVAFRHFLGIKLLCTFHIIGLWEGAGGRWLQALAVLSTFGICRSQTAQVGAFGWGVLLTAQVVRTWPYTLNHLILELILLVILVLHPKRLSPEAEQESKRTATVLWATLLSVWFFAGIQKIGHGRYLNGECMALALLGDGGVFGENVRAILSAVHRVLGTAPSARLPLDELTLVQFNAVERTYCLTLSWLVVGVEVGLPLLAFVTKARAWVLVGLTAAQAMVGVISGELDFALTGLGVIGLGSCCRPRIRYVLLSSLAVCFGLSRMLLR